MRWARILLPRESCSNQPSSPHSRIAVCTPAKSNPSIVFLLSSLLAPLPLRPLSLRPFVPCSSTHLTSHPQSPREKTHSPPPADSGSAKRHPASADDAPARSVTPNRGSSK